MRIALVVTGGFDRSGRDHVIPTLLSLVERLARRHQIVVYVLHYHPQPSTYPLLGATVRDLGRPNGIRRQYARLVDAMKRDGPFAVVHGYWALPAGLVAAAAGRRLGVPSLVTYDSGEFVALPDIGYGSQLRLRQRAAVGATSRLATATTVCTTHQARLARAHGASPLIVPFGVDAGVFQAAAAPEGPPWRLLHVASLNPVKDQVTLLRAFQTLIIRRNVEALLDVVGEDTIAGSIPELARSLAIADRVTFHGLLRTDALVPLYRQSHLFVLSSRHEAAAAVVLEAAACGLPVVGTSVGYVADWAPHRAVAVPTQNADALAGAIAALLVDPAQRQHLARAAREWVLAHDAEWTATEIERIYTTLATPGS
jgi:glycosyltransferase involved in cell wall biosynthesis